MKRPPKRTRPMPPDGLSAFRPAPEVLTWIEQHLLAEDGSIYNPDHKHLLAADLRVLWAPGSFTSKGKTVVGTAEQVMFRCNAWQRERQEQQLIEWFGNVPDFLITLDASYCSQCDDVAFCALVEHECYHIAHLKDAFGPAFFKDGRPKIGIQGHDVEEFVGVVRRYGVGQPGGALSRLVEAGKRQPEVQRLAVAGACGTCLRRVA